MVGTVGHLFIISAFVACIMSGIAYFLAARREKEEEKWKRIGRGAWWVMFAGIFAASALLIYLLVTNQFQYAYVYSNTSRDLPLKYLFSSFWAGQEGSFLLWITYTGMVGLALMKWGRRFEAPVMTVVAFCQVFMISMVVGLQFGPLPIGSSPFMLLAERFPDAPVLQVPGFVPADGNGLNDLLKNIWMVIHPPTLFIGFAAMLVPFAFAVAGLWKKQYTQWVRPAMPWAIFANLVLLAGIAMGGYWAYITLSFGGYWAWDPVENSSLVPWLVGIAAIHTMIAQRRSGTSQKAAILLSIVAYMFVVYSTFLTRSGILGDISVHSFVDLGLNNQLLLWIVAMGVVGFGLFFYRYPHLPKPVREPHVLSREFMIFTGAMILCALAAVIIVGTSAPIFGRIFRDNPSGVPIDFYNKWSLPLAIMLCIMAGIAQLFWWKKMNAEQLNKVVVKPLALSFASTVGVLMFTPFIERTIRYEALAEAGAQTSNFAAGLLAVNPGTFWAVYGEGILLLILTFAAFFAFFGNSAVLWKIGRGNLKLAGGGIAHVGLILMIFGIITSGAFNSPIVDGTGVPVQDHTGEVHSGERDNFIISRGETKVMDGYTVRYRGREKTPEGYSAFLLDFEDPRGRAFTAQPVVYKSDTEQWIQHPHVKKYFEQDLFIAVAPNEMFEDQLHDHDQVHQGPGGELVMQRGDSLVLGYEEFSVVFDHFEVNPEIELIPEENVEIAVAAVLRVTNLATETTRTVRPVYIIMQEGADHPFEYLQSRLGDWNVTFTFAGMQVDTESIQLMVEGVDVNPEDWLVVTAYRKPFISLLWLGTIVLLAGMGLAIFRRIGEERHHARRIM